MSRSLRRSIGRCLKSVVLVALLPCPAPAIEHAHEADHHAHHQHEAALHRSGYERSQRAYVVPPVVLVDAEGRPDPLAQRLDYDGPLLLNFIYTSCTTICPVMTATFARFRQQLGAEAQQVRLVSVSIDPQYDTPERLAAYARGFAAGDGWTFLTGADDSIVAVQQAFEVYRGSKADHAPVTFLRAGREAPWLRLDGLTSSADLMREYRALIGP